MVDSFSIWIELFKIKEFFFFSLVFSMKLFFSFFNFSLCYNIDLGFFSFVHVVF